MTTDMDSTSNSGMDATPTAANSGSENGQQSSGTSSVTKEDFDKLMSRLDKFERSAQSDKDRAVKRTNDRLDGLEEQVKPLLERAAEIMKGGVSSDQAITQAKAEASEAEMKQTMYEFAQAWKNGTLSVAQGSANQPQGVNVNEVISDFELDTNDPAVKLAFDGKQFKTVEEVELLAAKIIREKKKQPTPTPAQQPSQPAKTMVPASVNQLTEAYKKEMLASRGNRANAKEVREKYQKLGVNTDSVIFSV